MGVGAALPAANACPGASSATAARSPASPATAANACARCAPSSACATTTSSAASCSSPPSERDFDAGAAARGDARARLEREVKTRGRVPRARAGAAQLGERVVGGDLQPDDESGDACRFTAKLARMRRSARRRVSLRRRDRGDRAAGERVTGVRACAAGASADGRRLRRRARQLQSRCCSRRSASAFRSIRSRATRSRCRSGRPRRPRRPRVSLTDEACKIVISRLGNRLRAAGTAELTGYDTTVNAVRCAAIVRRIRELFPGARRRHHARQLDRAAAGDAQQRAGHRPHPAAQPVSEHRPRHARLDARLRLGRGARRPRLGSPAAKWRFRSHEAKRIASSCRSAACATTCAAGGAPGAPKMVLLHGWMDVSASFQFMVDELRGEWDVYRARLARLRAHRMGEGATATGFPTTSPTSTSLLDEIDADAPVNLVGHSLGGNVAALYAGVRPAARRAARQPRRLRHAAHARRSRRRSATRAGSTSCAIRRSCVPTPASRRWPSGCGQDNPRLTAEQARTSSRALGPRGARARAWCCAAIRRTRSSTRCSTATRRCARAGEQVTAPVLWVEGAESETLKRHEARRRAAGRAPRGLPRPALRHGARCGPHAASRPARGAWRGLIEEFLAR